MTAISRDAFPLHLECKSIFVDDIQGPPPFQSLTPRLCLEELRIGEYAKIDKKREPASISATFDSIRGLTFDAKGAKNRARSLLFLMREFHPMARQFDCPVCPDAPSQQPLGSTVGS